MAGRGIFSPVLRNEFHDVFAVSAAGLDALRLYENENLWYVDAANQTWLVCEVGHNVMEQRGQNMEERKPEMGLPQPPLEITGGVQEITGGVLENPEAQWVLDPVEGPGGVAEFLAMLGFENPVLVSEDGQVLEIPIGELNRAGFGTREDIGSLLYKEPDWEGFFYVQNRQDILQQQQQQLEMLPQQQSLQLHMADQSF